MSKDIKQFVTTCDICQKVKAKRHAPYGLLKPIPIPSKPFEVITMDFISELPLTKNQHDNILVVVDKLTKFSIFIPTRTTIDEEESAKLLFDNVFTKFGLPRQIISDRDTKFTGLFWEETCKLFKIKRALSTAYHPQADGQSEIMNQILETALRTYISPQKDNWDEFLPGFALSYNGITHSATGFTPSMLLFGFQPEDGHYLPHSQADQVSRPESESESERGKRQVSASSATDPSAEAMHEASTELRQQFDSLRTRAKDSLSFAQASFIRYYNKGRLTTEFNIGDEVLLNQFSLRLLGVDSVGLGHKLLPKYDGPFEITANLSPVMYRIRLPSSYRIHNIVNIAHLELYNPSPQSYHPRPVIPIQRAETAAQEWEVDSIVDERTRRRGLRRIKQYRVRYNGFGPQDDEWVPKSFLKNAPDVLSTWELGNLERDVLRLFLRCLLNLSTSSTTQMTKNEADLLPIPISIQSLSSYPQQSFPPFRYLESQVLDDRLCPSHLSAAFCAAKPGSYASPQFLSRYPLLSALDLGLPLATKTPIRSSLKGDVNVAYSTPSTASGHPHSIDDKFN